MEEKFEEKYHQIEKTHFWFKSRRKYLRDLLKDVPKNATILDIGCSSGILLDKLREDGFSTENLYGIDISEKGVANCRKNGLHNTFVMDAQNINLEKKFDIIIASDCLEHLEKDENALKNWHSMLNTNGTAYIFVPAFMQLWSHHDEVNMHFRRYTLLELETKMKKADFKIKKASYWNFFLFMPIYFFRKLTKSKQQNGDNNSGDLQNNPIANSFLYRLIVLENKLLKYFNFPFGVSAFCIAKK